MRNIIKHLVVCVLTIVPLSLYSQSDLIIYRDGSEKTVKLIQVSLDEVVYSISSKGGLLFKSKDNPIFKDDIKDIYMLRYDKRGNVYITPEGKRITGESQKIDKDADLIYLVDGGMIQAYNLHISSDAVVYEIKSQGGGGLFGKKSHVGPLKSLDINKVFLIQYKDGTRDIITNLAPDKEKEGRLQAKEHTNQETADPIVNERKVVFHYVQNGETLSSIAKRYQVTIEELIEWNDLPQGFKSNANLKPEMQLMIYVNPQMSI